MTTRTITGTYSAGYNLSSGFSEVDITASGRIGGFGLLSSNGALVVNYGRLQATFSGANGLSMTAGGKLLNGDGAAIAGGPGQASGGGSQPGGNGGSGVAIYVTGGVSNYSVINGGMGGYGGVNSISHPSIAGGIGGAGGAAIVFSGDDGLVNFGAVQGGQGGHGGYGLDFSAQGGGGGGGIVLQAGGGITNLGGEIYGGAGGTGGKAVYYIVGGSRPGAGGQGGTGVIVGTHGLVYNTRGLIEGGLGGAVTPGAFDHGGDGGFGGLGIDLVGPGSVANGGTIMGGAGRAGQSGGVSGGGNGGNGGDGIYGSAGGKISNTGLIRGGDGGAGGGSSGGGYHGVTGFQGVGVDLVSGGILINGSRTNHVARIDGYYGVQTGIGGPATVTNFGVISGEAGGWAVSFASSTDTLVVEAGCTFAGGINGGGGTLELATGKGAFNAFDLGDIIVSGIMPTTTFQNFGTLEIGAKAQFTTANSTIFANQNIIDNGILSVGVLGVIGAFTLAGQLRGVGRSGSGSLLVTTGTATFTSGALLLIPSVRVEGDSATVLVKTSLSYAGQWIQGSGTLNVASGDTMTFTGGANAFIGTIAGAGQIVFQGGFEVLQDLTQTGSGTLSINAAAVKLSGAISHSGTISINSSTVTIDTAGVSLGGSGAVLFNDAGGGEIVGASSGATLTLIDHFQGAGDLGGGSMSLVNQGAIDGNAAGSLIIDTGANAVINSGTILASSGGGVTVISAINNSGLLSASGGNLTIDGAVTGGGAALINGGTLSFASAFSEAVTFSGSSGELSLALSQTFGGTISGFSKFGGTMLDLADITGNGGSQATYSGTKSGGILTVTDGVHTAHISLKGDYRTVTFVTTSDLIHGGVIVQAFSAPAPSPVASANIVSSHALVAAMAAFEGAPMAGTGISDQHLQSAVLLALPRGGIG